MGYIYLITNMITKKQYVGQTLCKDVETRWRQHKARDPKSIGRYLLSAYGKYGIEAFKYQVICVCFDEDCNIYEEQYIKKFNTLVPNGYNLRAGGKNSKQHPESIKLRADKMRGANNPNFGRIVSEDERKRQSIAMMGEKNPNFGIKITKVRKEKLSGSMKKIWEERRNNGTINDYINKTSVLTNTSFAIGHISPNRKRIGKYDDNNNLLEEYESTVEAGLKNNIQRQTISKVCNGNPKYKRAGGFIWKFISDQTLVS